MGEAEVLKRISLICDWCGETLKDPIYFKCCDKIICCKHLDENKNNTRRNHCNYCDKSFEKLDQVSTTQLIKSIRSKLYTKEYLKANEDLNILKVLVSRFQTLDAKALIDQHYQDITNRIDLERELFKAQIDTHCIKLLDELSCEHGKFKSLSVEEYPVKDIESTQDRIKVWNDDKKDLFHDSNYWNSLDREIKLAINEIQQKHRQFKQELFKEKLEYIRPFHLFNATDIFGRLSRIKETSFENEASSYDQSDEYQIISIDDNQQMLIIDNSGNSKELATFPVNIVKKVFLLSNETAVIISTYEAVHLYSIYTGKYLRSFFHESSLPKSFVKLNENEFLILYNNFEIVKYNVAISFPIFKYFVKNPNVEEFIILNYCSTSNVLTIFKESRVNQDYNILLLNINEIITEKHKYSISLKSFSNFLVQEENFFIFCTDFKVYQMKLDENKCEFNFIFSERNQINSIEKISKSTIAIATKYQTKPAINIWNIDLNIVIKTIKLEDDDFAPKMNRLNSVTIVCSNGKKVFQLNSKDSSYTRVAEGFKSLKILHIF